MKKPGNGFPKKVIAEAQKIGRDEDLFIAAEAQLRNAIRIKDRKSELFWRKVFAAYTEMAPKLESGPDDEFIIDLWHCATRYMDGSNPGAEEDPQRIKQARAEYVEGMKKFDADPVPDVPVDDSDIPF